MTINNQYNAFILSLFLYPLTLLATGQSTESINPQADIIIYRHSTTSTAKDIIWPTDIQVGNINIVTKNLKPSAKMPAHYHQHFIVIATVLQGDVAIQYGEDYDKKLIVNAGDSFSIPTNLCHINGNASNKKPAKVRVAYLIEKNKKMKTISCPHGSRVDKIIINNGSL